MTYKRSSSDVRKITYTGKGENAHLALPKEVSEILRRAGIEFMRVTTTNEGILLTPYREPIIPEWAREDA